MPEISRFHGIVVTIFFDDHGPPHFHAVSSEHRIAVNISSGEVRGAFPPRQLRLLLAWRAMHERELLSNWWRARAGEPLQSIAPLE